MEKEKEEKIHSLESKNSLIQDHTKTSEQLSKNLALSLMDLIDKVNLDGVTPESVNASCNAAAQIYKILHLNYQMKKEGF